MTKPANFPERKRQRRLGALARMKPVTKHTGRSNDAELARLHELTGEGPQRHVRTKKDRSDRARLSRA